MAQLQDFTDIPMGAEKIKQAAGGTPDITFPTDESGFGITEIGGGMIPPALGVDTSITSSIAGALEQAKATALQIQESIKNLQTQQPTEKQSLIDKYLKGAEKKPEPLDTAAAYNQALTQFGYTPEAFQAQQGMIGQLTQLQTELQSLEEQKQAQLMGAEQRLMGRPGGIIRGEQAFIERQWNSRIAAKSGQANVVYQQYQLSKGLLEDATKMADKIVSLMTYDQEQKVRDYEYTQQTYKDLFNMMSAEENEQWDRGYKEAQNEWNQAMDVAKLDLQREGLDIEWAREARLGAEAGVSTKPLSVSEIKNLQAMYPNADIQYGDTEDSSQEKISRLTGEIPPPPEYVKTFGQYKSAGWAREQVESSWISQYNEGKTAGMQIKDKKELEKNFPEIKSALDTAYGKEATSWEKVKTWWGNFWD